MPSRASDEGLDRAMTETRFRQAFLLLLVTAISVAFVAMIRTFVADDPAGGHLHRPELPGVSVAARPARWPAGTGGRCDARAAAGDS